MRMGPFLWVLRIDDDTRGELLSVAEVCSSCSKAVPGARCVGDEGGEGGSMIVWLL